jgi:hypothetical protein
MLSSQVFANRRCGLFHVGFCFEVPHVSGGAKLA